jgi:hypothetical protein
LKELADDLARRYRALRKRDGDRFEKTSCELFRSCDSKFAITLSEPLFGSYS